jgi:flagellar M-ring protein FliF
MAVAQPASPQRAPGEPYALQPWLLAGAAILVALAAIRWLRGRRVAVAEPLADDFDAMLDAARSRALDDPRVTADVIKLWMRT